MTHATDVPDLTPSEWRVVSIGLKDAAKCDCSDLPGSRTSGFARFARMLTDRDAPKPLADKRLEALRNFVCATQRRRRQADELQLCARRLARQDSWSVDHMGFSTYVGQFTDVSATLDLNVANPSASRLTAIVKTDSVGSFKQALDTHLKSADFLDTAKHPTARFQATRIRMIDAESAEITGNLTLRGVTKPIVMAANFNQAGVNPVDQKYTVGFDGHTRIKRSDFGISYGLPLLGDDVTLHLEAEFKLKPHGATNNGDK